MMHTPNNHGAPSGGPAAPPTPTPNRLLATKPREDALEQAAGALPDARDEPDASPFRLDGDAYPTRRDGRGVWVEFGALCAALGKHAGNQARALKKKPWATLVAVPDGRPGRSKKATFFLHVDSVPGWLFQLGTAGLPPDKLAKLNRYKCESARALKGYWGDGGAINPRATRPQAWRLLGTIAIVLADDPVRHRSLWVAKLADAFAPLCGSDPREGHSSFSPSPLHDAGNLYDVVRGKNADAARHEHAGSGASRAKRGQARRAYPNEALDRELGKVEMLALQCRTMREFWGRLRQYDEGVARQLGVDEDDGGGPPTAR
jgi:hypothetical protein